MNTLRILLFLSTLFLLSCEKSKDKAEEIPKNYLLNELLPDETGIDFTNKITEDPEHSIINYIYYYNGAGVAAGDINNDGLPDLYFVSNMAENKLYLNKGNMEFQDITNKSGISSKSSWNTGVSMVDINGDGFLDIYLCSVSGLLDFKGRNELFVNNGDGTFTEKAAEYGLDFKGFSTQAYFFDYDKDMDLDVYIVNHAIHTTLSHGSASVRSNRVPLVGDVLLENKDGKFTDVSEKAGIYGGQNGYGLSATLADFNNDGWDDLYVCNDFHEDDYYYINNQDGTFSEELDASFSTISRFSMGSDAGDINGDGYQDLISLDMLPKNEKVVKESEGDDAMYNMQKRLKKLGYKDQYARNMLQINQNGNYFVETALFNNVGATDWSWGPLVADFNNDGHQDLFISNGIYRRPNDLDFKKFVSNAFKNRSQAEGLKWLYKAIDSMPRGDIPNEIFMGNSSNFVSKTGEWIAEKPSLSNGATYADLDLDGDLDLILNNLNQPAQILRNSTNESSNFISLKFNFQNGNSEGIGTKAILHSAGKHQIKQFFNSRGFISATDSRMVFGLGKAKKIDSIEIIWPDNKLQTIKNPAINQHIVIKYVDTLENYNFKTLPKKNVFQRDSKLLTFSHKEDTYDDFFNEKLIPYRVSTMGPAVAKGDLNADGLQDLFVGNASGSPVQIFINTGSSLNSMANSGIEKDSLYEDNAAVIFDADNDGDNDIYVGRGIQEIGISRLYNDALFLNENGKFIKSENNIPNNFLNTSTLTTADYDLDGDMDIFVGNLSEPGNFGKKVTSYILKNNGTGNFSVSDEIEILSHVTYSRWEDINGDNYPELFITTEWDQPKIFSNKNGKLAEMELPENLKGLWQSLNLFDIDGDGDLDVLLGNWGLNTRFKASNNAPLRMYHGDFNQDGREETVVAYSINGQYYPLNSRDELVAQTNMLSKKYPTHAAFAMQSVEDIYGKNTIANSTIYEINNLNSGYLRNDNGNFTSFIPFPDLAQLGPINSFENIEIEGENCVIAAGNNLRVNTYHGGYTSMKGILIKNANTVQPLSHYGMEAIDQEIRAIKSIKLRNQEAILLFPNNGEVIVYKK